MRPRQKLAAFGADKTYGSKCSNEYTLLALLRGKHWRKTIRCHKTKVNLVSKSKKGRFLTNIGYHASHFGIVVDGR